MADGYDEDDELGLLKLADYAIVTQAIAPQAKCIWTKPSEGIKDAALKGGATKFRLTKGARVVRLGDERGREILRAECARRGSGPHIRRPTHSQERMRKKKSARSVRNDVGRVAGKRMRLLEDSFDGLHGSDGVKLVPAVIRVVDIGTPDEIPLANHRFKIGTVILAAGLRRVGLPYFPLAYRFED